jgi:hypothetical protein
MRAAAADHQFIQGDNMQAIRASLTRLKNQVESELPDESDVFGFHGISKKMILSFIDETYQISYTLSNLEPKFEITILKRKLTHLFEKAKDALTDTKKDWNRNKNFDEFLTHLTKIREETRLTYLVVVDKGLRTETESARITEEYNKLLAAYDNYKSLFDEISAQHETIKQAYEKSSSVTSELDEYLSQAEEAARRINSLQNSSESSYGITAKYESDIKERRDSIDEVNTKLNNLEKKAKTLLGDAETSKRELLAIKEELITQSNKNAEQQADIQGTLDNANRMGMAGSFKSRKDELSKPILIWSIVFVSSVAIIFLIGHFLIYPYLSKATTFSETELIAKIALVFPFIWLAWMSAKQYGYLSRIREDYAYKYASAMAFEGYKKHTKEINPNLLERLLAVSIENLAQNPIRLYNTKDNHASPLQEILSTFKHSKPQGEQ